MTAATIPPVKVLLIGDSGVGKSSLMLRFSSNTFSEEISATIGIDFKVKATEIVDPTTNERRSITMQIWDTAGQERFRTLTSSYYRGAHAVVLVYDVNEPQSFQNLSKWLEEAKTFCGSSSSGATSAAVFLLIGNKIDRAAAAAGPMAVPKASAQEFARENKMLFCLCSAKTKEGVVDAFDEVARAVYDRTVEAGDSRMDGGRNGGVRLDGREPGRSGGGGGGGSGMCC